MAKNNKKLTEVVEEKDEFIEVPSTESVTKEEVIIEEPSLVVNTESMFGDAIDPSEVSEKELTDEELQEVLQESSTFGAPTHSIVHEEEDDDELVVEDPIVVKVEEKDDELDVTPVMGIKPMMGMDLPPSDPSLVPSTNTPASDDEARLIATGVIKPTEAEAEQEWNKIPECSLQDKVRAPLVAHFLSEEIKKKEEASMSKPKPFSTLFYHFYSVDGNRGTKFVAWDARKSPCDTIMFV